MKMVNDEALCFDDVLLVPQYSTLKSRSEADISTSVAGIELKVPIISANMDSVTEVEMATAMYKAGGLGILHRYASVDSVVAQVGQLDYQGIPAVPSVGVQLEDRAAAKRYLEVGAKVVCLDIAHGDSEHALDMINFLKDLGLKVIAGNVATAEGTDRLIEAGADAVKVGIAGGSVCSTRYETGHGVPQLTAVIECYAATEGKVALISDGGIRRTSDVVKAIAAGADAVMIGGMLAGCIETPGAIVNGTKTYRGMASRAAQMAYKGRIGNTTPEGVSTTVPLKGFAADIVAGIAGGLRSGMSYSGVRTLQELREKAVMRRVSPATAMEDGPRALKK